jgi:hypothetical protein
MPRITSLSPRRLALGFATAAILAMAPSLVAAQTPTPVGTTQWRATAVAANEVPPVSSTATGTFTARLDETAGTLSWDLNVPMITNATMAHLHQGAAGVNGPVVMDLWIPVLGQTSANTVATSATSRTLDLKGPLAGDWTGFVSALKAGTIYVNVHTTANPGGEIRAQVVSAAATATPTGTATASPTATATGTASPTATASATPAATVSATPSATSTTPAGTGTTAPAPAKTGTGGLGAVSSTSLLVVLGLVATAGAVTVVGRRLTRDR